MLTNERTLWQGGCRSLAGVDEVGRGPLAGPVVVAAVIIDPAFALAEELGILAGLTDSKQLLPEVRERFCSVLRAAEGVAIGLGWADPLEIDRVNILQATYLAMSRALAALPVPADHALVDGLPPKGLPCESTAIVGGDGKSLSIAAASVIAKVFRDEYMREQDVIFPGYGFASHKGYGTPEHMQALLELGPCALHRRSFRPVRDAEDLMRRRSNPGEDGA